MSLRCTWVSEEIHPEVTPDTSFMFVTQCHRNKTSLLIKYWGLYHIDCKHETYVKRIVSFRHDQGQLFVNLRESKESKQCSRPAPHPCYLLETASVWLLTCLWLFEHTNMFPGRPSNHPAEDSRPCDWIGSESLSASSTLANASRLIFLKRGECTNTMAIQYELAHRPPA